MSRSLNIPSHVLKLLIAAVFLAGFFALGLDTSRAQPKDEGFVLISADDLEQWDREIAALQMAISEGLEIEIGSKFVPVEYAPLISVEKPGEVGDLINSPIDFILTFEALDGAEIDLDSIKIEYKRGFWFDVTERILENAVIEATGITAIGAEIPDGKHKMRLSVKDTKGRKARAQISFKVG